MLSVLTKNIFEFVINRNWVGWWFSAVIQSLGSKSYPAENFILHYKTWMENDLFFHRIFSSSDTFLTSVKLGSFSHPWIFMLEHFHSWMIMKLPCLVNLRNVLAHTRVKFRICAIKQTNCHQPLTFFNQIYRRIERKRLFWSNHFKFRRFLWFRFCLFNQSISMFFY